MINVCPKCKAENLPGSRVCSTCGVLLDMVDNLPVSHTETLETPREKLTRGSRFADRYEIIEELGHGGMGRVYRVEDTKTGEELALKLIKPEIASDKKTIERFAVELTIAHKITHKNVSRMHHLGEDKGSYYITMEYVAGGDLKKLIRKSKQLTARTAVSIARQICEGLAEAHKLGVVHRDLKPGNIVLDEDGNARIMDFGIARSISEKGITDAGMIIGTPEYMSPEQVEAKEVDQRSDIYSLGIILYEMVTGRLPFEADTPFAVGVKQKSEKPENPKEINPQIHDDLNRVILRCLEKDKKARYQTAEEVNAELNNIEKGIPSTEREIPARKPLTSKEITVQFNIKKIFIPAFIFIAVVIIGVIVWQLLSSKETIPVPSDKPSLAVMYFENNTGDSSLDHYRKAISDLLITDLGQSKHLRILSGAQLFNILSQLDQLEARSFSSEVLKRVADKGGVRHILMGSYTKAGGMFRINYSLLEADTAEQIGSDVVEGRGEESVFSMVDELTRKIKTNFRLSNEVIASDFDMNVGEITTSSPKALQYYTEGAEFDHSQKYEKSIELMKKAVEFDPNFAMAYRSMGITYQDMGYLTKAKESLWRAFELSDKVSMRERLQIQGDFYWQSSKTIDKAIEAYSKLLELYPEDSNANINLGGLYAMIEEWDKASERYEVLRKNKDESIFTYLQLANTSRAKGDFDEAKEILEYYRDNISDNSSIHFQLHRLYRQQGKLDQALLELNKGDTLNPHPRFIRSRAIIYYLKDELAAAGLELQKLLEVQDRLYHVSSRGYLADLFLMQGKYKDAKDQVGPAIDLLVELDETGWIAWWHSYLFYILYRTADFEDALKECDRMWKIAQDEEDFEDQVEALHNRGLALVAMKSHDEAIKTADELKVMIEQWLNQRLIRWYYHLKGEIELAQKNYSAAVDHFQQAIALVPYGPLNKDALFVESLASALYRSGDLERALLEYQRITALTTGRLSYGDIYAKSFYMLAKIYEQLGDKTKAIEHYERFLNLWKDADPGLTEVEDARKNLAGLINN